MCNEERVGSGLRLVRNNGVGICERRSPGAGLELSRCRDAARAKAYIVITTARWYAVVAGCAVLAGEAEGAGAVCAAYTANGHAFVIARFV